MGCAVPNDVERGGLVDHDDDAVEWVEHGAEVGIAVVAGNVAGMRIDGDYVIPVVP